MFGMTKWSLFKGSLFHPGRPQSRSLARNSWQPTVRDGWLVVGLQSLKRIIAVIACERLGNHLWGGCGWWRPCHWASSSREFLDFFPVVVVGRSPRCQARVWRDTPVSSLLDLRAEGYKLHIKSMDFWCFFLQQRREGNNFLVNQKIWKSTRYLIEICTRILLVGLGYIPVPINHYYTTVTGKPYRDDFSAAATDLEKKAHGIHSPSLLLRNIWCNSHWKWILNFDPISGRNSLFFFSYPIQNVADLPPPMIFNFP